MLIYLYTIEYEYIIISIYILYIIYDCILEGNDNGTYTYNSSNQKVTLNFSDTTNGAQTEILNNVEFTTTKLNYTWDEDGNGTDEHYLEYTKN